MAVRFIEGFDHTTSQTEGKWDLWDATWTPGRFGNAAYFDNRGDNVDKSFGAASHATWIFGFASLRGNNNQYLPLKLYDGTPASGTVQCVLVLAASGEIQFYRGDMAALVATGTTIMAAGVWYFIEWKVTVNNSTGVFQVKVNGVNEPNLFLSSQDTQTSANALAAGFRFGQAGSSASMSHVIDDLYVLDGSGSAPTNDFIGDCRVETLFPNGNGNSSQFDGSDGNQTDNYLLADEATPDDETTYVESPDVNDKDTYAYGNLATTAGTVFAVQIDPRWRKTTAGVRSMVSVARHSGSEVDSSAVPLSTSYVYTPDVREAKPGGGTWSISDVNGAEFGVKVSA